MTAHRSKGLEWPLVVVAGVQDGEWPDVRARGSLLQGDRLSPDGVLPPPSPWAAAAEERRLFYVACSRARSRLVVTAVASGSDEGDQPSRFVGELHAHLAGAPARRTLLAGGAGRDPRGRCRCVARSPSCDASASRPTTPPYGTRVAAQLARLASIPAGRSAHPDRWWGLAERTTNDTPVRDPDEPLQTVGQPDGHARPSARCSGSLGHEAKGERGTSAAQGFGSIVHALAAEAVRGGVEPDVDEMAAHLDDVWERSDSPPWISPRERDAAVEALEKFVQWHREQSPRGARGRARLQRHDRRRRSRSSAHRARWTGWSSATTAVHVVDFKTSKTALSGPQVSDECPARALPGRGRSGGDQRARPGGRSGRGRAGPAAQRRAPDVGLPKVAAQPGPSPEHDLRGRAAASGRPGHRRRGVRGQGRQERASTATFKRVCPARDSGASILGGKA